MPIVGMIALSGLCLTVLAVLRAVAVTAQLSEAVEAVDNQPWESL